MVENELDPVVQLTLHYREQLAMLFRLVEIDLIESDIRKLEGIAIEHGIEKSVFDGIEGEQTVNEENREQVEKNFYDIRRLAIQKIGKELRVLVVEKHLQKKLEDDPNRTSELRQQEYRDV